MKVIKNVNSAAVDQQTVETLTELLDSAKKGELRSVLFVDMYANGDIGSGWSGMPNRNMVGELEKIKLRLLLQEMEGEII